ncbi:YgiT-type zinc finger domain [uncultured Ruminococcus sp.]|uniref:type II toxin-antitoxin system MqsA family antitoxin n=1 Tax=Massiliimalia timonensis TaxID=1987501 RepID=UPI0008206900|nr:type II toxin-antitoxin system MqsA family antitoxin [Massiliimalia timonensis]SCG97319.1 YgiT-type zinc finger domain [uncultured Clostridium sp.]SCH93393.1 YgiT-type zinc finger domain [uncultured Ruminococcus sp.]
MKTCFLCKGDMIEGKTLHVVELQNGCIIVVKNVPCLKCSQCGETWISGTVTERLEQIIDTIENTLTEIAVVDYETRVA